MVSIKFSLIIMAIATMTQAYTNNCEGSALSPTKADCDTGLSTIDVNEMYPDQTQFSFGDCYIIYATNGAGPQKVSGQKIKDTAQDILDHCKNRHGSFGTNTNDCSVCHVTVNYRASKKFKA